MYAESRQNCPLVTRAVWSITPLRRHASHKVEDQLEASSAARQLMQVPRSTINADRPPQRLSRMHSLPALIR